jgi:hypothetical protein
MALRWTAAAMHEAFRLLPALRAALAALRKGNKQPRCCPKGQGRLTSFTAALARKVQQSTGQFRRQALLVSLIDCYVVQLSQVFMLRVFPFGTNY